MNVFRLYHAGKQGFTQKAEDFFLTLSKFD